MGILDGLLFGLGRDVVLPIVLLVSCIVIALMVEVVKAFRAWLWRVRGVPCGATHQLYPTCTLTRWHSESHAGPWTLDSISRSRLRWSKLTHGEMSYLEVDRTPTPASDD